MKPRLVALALIAGGVVALSPAEASAPAARAHPVSTRALCTGSERVHGRVAPGETSKGQLLVGGRFWITGAAPGSSWSYALELTSTDGRSSTGQVGDGVASADLNGRVELGGAAAAYGNENFFRLVAEEQAVDPIGSSGSSCLLTVKVRY